MKRFDFNNESKDIIVVCDKPYMYCDVRVDRATVPEGLIMYEVADAESNGRFARIAKGIAVDFLGTIIGKEELPVDESGTYYCKCDTDFDERRDQYMSQLDDLLDNGEIDEEEHEKRYEEYDENHFPEDEDGYYIEHDVSVEEYLSNYEKYKRDIKSGK